MAQDISELFAQALDRQRSRHEQEQTRNDDGLSVLERDFERVKDEVRKLKPLIESHPRVNYFWIFTDKIIVDLRIGPRQNTVQLTVQLYHPGNSRFKRGIYGYQACGYEMALASVDEAVSFFATQCGKLLA